MQIQLVTKSYTTNALFEALAVQLDSSSQSPLKEANLDNLSGMMPIPAGGRNTTLTSAGGALRRMGFEQENIESILTDMNLSRCDPPLPQAEVQQIAQSVSRYAPASHPLNIRHTLNDVGNAERLIGSYGADLRFILESKQWLFWTNGRWQVCNHGNEIMQLAKHIATNLYNEMSNYRHDPSLMTEIARHAKNSHAVPRLEATIKLVSKDPQVAIHLRHLNHNKMLLGVANGVIDLHTSRIRPYRRDDLITSYSPVMFDPDAKCPIFHKFLQQITDNFRDLPQNKRKKAHKEFVAYIRRIVGYCLTGRTSEQTLFFFYGSGANGKSTLLNVMQALLGHDLAKQTQSETLMDSQNSKSSQSNDIARLAGARLVTANETEDGKFLSESLIKQLTGGDPITCRFLYQEFFEFVPEFKIIISGNHKPIIRGTDNGIWRRIQIVPFKVTIPEHQRDPHLESKLKAELPGILNWALKGCRDWQRQGLNPPPIVTQAVDTYREEMDLLGQWIQDNCMTNPTALVSATDAYRDYTLWALDQGLKSMSQAAFGRRLSERGFSKKRTQSGNYYCGFQVKLRSNHIHFVQKSNSL